VVENTYQNEIEAFFKAVETGEAPEYGFWEVLETLHLIDKIEGALFHFKLVPLSKTNF